GNADSLLFYQAEDGIRDFHVTGVQTCALPISYRACRTPRASRSLAQKTAVGRSGRPRTRCPASLPAVTVRAPQDSSLSALDGRPDSLIAVRAPRRRSLTCWRRSGPLT